MKRVIFVDDESKVTDGLKRMLRGQRNEWDMLFVNSGQDALDAMAVQPFDVIVSDMRMPKMDGAMLLSRVQDEHPGTVRIVLSGHTELEAALRAVPVAHQFLSKPCESAVIREVVTRACGLQTLLGDTALQERLGSIDTLPAIPRVYNELISALADPDVSLDEVAAILEQDTGITTKVLQLVNSSLFGIARQVDTLRQATTYLGTNMLRNLTLSMEVFRAFEVDGHLAGFSLEDEQSHAMLAARIARRLLDDKALSEHAFLAAMLHDVGKLILATKLPEEYERTLGGCHANTAISHLTEEKANGVSHAEIGAYLLGIWGMPYPIVEAVANHHHPSRVPHEKFDVLGAVHVANALAREQAASEGEAAEWAGSLLDLEYLESIGMTGEVPRWIEIAAAEEESARAAA